MVGGWGGGIEKMVICPLLLESLLDLDEDVALLGLSVELTQAQLSYGNAGNTHNSQTEGFSGALGAQVGRWD
jgi:hypothetical protein